jgi:CubicO group peptidase (beta-lactamase class C family)
MKRTIAVLICFILAVFLSIHSFPQTTSPSNGDKYSEKLLIFEKFVRNQMEKDKIPGLTIGFYKDDYVWVKGFGYADLENKVPAKPESAYRLASITKTFTSVAILQLVEKGKIKLDAEIQTYVPYYQKQQWPVTVRQLLAHTGGGQYGSGLGPEYVSTRDVVGRISKNPLRYEPDTKYQYTTSGYNLLGAAIEEVSGKSFGDYLREHIFLPMGMNDTRMNSERDLIPNRVRTYERTKDGIKVAQFVDVSTRFGGGGLVGTIPDLLKWARAVDSGKVLSKESLDTMYSHHTLKNGRYAAHDYVLGWWNMALNGEWVPWHGGEQIGTSTLLFRFPAKNMAIAFAVNTHNAYPPFIERLYELLTDEPWEIPVNTKDQASQTFYQALRGIFIYGGALFDRRREPFTNDPQELIKAFDYFNRTVNLGSLQSNYQTKIDALADGFHPVTGSTTNTPQELIRAFDSYNDALNLSSRPSNYQTAIKAIADGFQPVTGAAFIKVGSFMSAKLREKYGAEREKVYHTMGAIPFFADYIRLYQSQPNFPQGLRFNEAFEKVITKWNEDWTRTWKDYTRNLQITPESDFDEIGRKLQPLFANAEVYPYFIDSLLAIPRDLPAMKAVKLAVELYPNSARANGKWGIFLWIVNEYGEEGREYLRKNFGEVEESLPYLKKSVEHQPDGFAANKNVWNDIVRKMLEAGKIDDTLSLLNLAIEHHPKQAHFHAGLCEAYSRKGMKEKATEACKKVLDIDPNNVPAQEMMKKLNK